MNRQTDRGSGQEPSRKGSKRWKTKRRTKAQELVVWGGEGPEKE